MCSKNVWLFNCVTKSVKQFIINKPKMFGNTNSIIINQLRNQTLARQRLTLLNTNRNQFSNNLSINNYSLNGGHGHHIKLFWDSLKAKFNENFLIFSHLLREQSNVYMSLRLRRMAQICSLYSRIYSETTVHKLMSQLITRMRSRTLTLIKRSNNKSKNSIRYLLSVACGVFCWDKERITDRDLKDTVEEFNYTVRASVDIRYNNDSSTKSSSFSVSAESNNNTNNEDNDSHENDTKPEKSFDAEWEPVIMRDDLRVWRRGLKNTSLYQYKVFGTFHDIPARTFFKVQMDTNFRKVWDKLVIKLDIIEKEPIVIDIDGSDGEDSGNEVLHWVMRYPFPMNTRDYVYLRRSRIDVNKNVMVLVSKSIEHPKLPETSEHVRVFDYSSQMVIKPHKSFDDCGFDYMLTYFDDPRAAFPTPAYNWMASCGVPDFVEKLHMAAVQLYHSNNPNKHKYSKQYYNNATQNQNSTHSEECAYA